MNILPEHIKANCRKLKCDWSVDLTAYKSFSNELERHIIDCMVANSMMTELNCNGLDGLFSVFDIETVADIAARHSQLMNKLADPNQQ